MAGIWQAHLHNQLLWRQTYRAPQKSLVLSFPFWDLAPSWSWASLNAAVEWPLHVQEVGNRLCTITVDKESNTLRVNGMFLTVLHESCVSITGEPGAISMTTTLPRFTGTIRVDFYLDAWFLHKVSISAADSLRYLIHNTSTLPVQLQSHPLLSSIECLVLWKDSDLKGGAYRRVGFARIHGDVLNGPESRLLVRSLLSAMTEIYNQVHHDPSRQAGPYLIRIQ